jgi:hypothetical protein
MLTRLFEAFRCQRCELGIVPSRGSTSAFGKFMMPIATRTGILLISPAIKLALIIS